MGADYEKLLAKWTSAEVMDAATAERIRAYERQCSGENTQNHLVTILLVLGGILLAAGAMLFVAAHWQRLSPSSRFALVLVLVVAFHVLAGTVSGRMPVLGKVLHGVGTGCLGAGIFLAGQIFNLDEDWASGFLLWGMGAAAAWWIRRDWVQSSIAAILFPIWATGEWSLRTWGYARTHRVAYSALFLLSIAYLTAIRPDRATAARRVACVLGWIACIPLALTVLFSFDVYGKPDAQALPPGWKMIGWSAAILVPLATTIALQGPRLKNLWLNVLGIPWIWVLGTMSYRYSQRLRGGFSHFWHVEGPYLWCAIGALGMIASGIFERRKERVNLGLLGFGITVTAFYFSSVMEKMGRSLSLLGLGALFLVLGVGLFEARKRILKRMA